MPLSLVPLMVLRATIRPSASNDTNAVLAMSVKTLLLTSPDICSNQMPAPPLPVSWQSVMRMSRPDRQCSRPRRAGSGMLPPSKVRPIRTMPSAPSASSSAAPPLKTSRLAPRTPISWLPGASRNRPLR
ncbi:hypothetical protein ACVMB0_004202 [Bradyrhizobium sp. USDA 4451]